MKVALLSDFIIDIKNWIFNWDQMTFIIITCLIGSLIAVSAISIVKNAFGENAKFKFLSFIFLLLLAAMLTIILLIRI